MKQAITEVLYSNDWTIDHITGTARKRIETAAGGREAFIVVSKEWGSDMLFYGQRIRFKLNAEYWSEGNNVLSTTIAYIVENDTQEDAVHRVRGFIAAVEKAIDGTYARRLYLRK